MTKLFNSMEELNEFLKGGKNIDHIELQAGMIAVSVASACSNVSANVETASSSSVYDFVNKMKDENILRDEYGVIVSSTKKGEFGLALACLSEAQQIQVLRALIATASTLYSSIGKEYFEEVLEKLTKGGK